jgi:hypothetical protein
MRYWQRAGFFWMPKERFDFVSCLKRNCAIRLADEWRSKE